MEEEEERRGGEVWRKMKKMKKGEVWEKILGPTLPGFIRTRMLSLHQGSIAMAIDLVRAANAAESRENTNISRDNSERSFTA